MADRDSYAAKFRKHVEVFKGKIPLSNDPTYLAEYRGSKVRWRWENLYAIMVKAFTEAGPGSIRSATATSYPKKIETACRLLLDRQYSERMESFGVSATFRAIASRCSVKNLFKALQFFMESRYRSDNS